jgi:hypothetical protein
MANPEDSMTPQDRQLIDDLFDRLATVEGQPRDPQAMAAIAEGLRRAPNATYALVQTVLLQDEALARPGERIAELERGVPAAPATPGGFLDSMRDTLFGQNQPRRGGSVPPSGGASDRLASTSGAAPERAQPDARATGGGAGSFLGTAAAAAAGVVGGSLLMNSIRGLTGGAGGGEKSQSLASDTAGERASPDRASPWGDGGADKDSLARDAGLNDIGSGGRGGEQRAAQQDHAGDDDGVDHASYDDEDDSDDDFDDGDFDDGDFA